MFEMANSNSMGHLGTGRGLPVRLVSIDKMIRRAEAPAPDLIKMDIEGAEYDALFGGINMLKAHRPTLFLATHGLDVHRACCKFLRDLQYDLQSLENTPLDECSELVARPRMAR